MQFTDILTMVYNSSELFLWEQITFNNDYINLSIYKTSFYLNEVKLAVAPCGSSDKNCWGWEGFQNYHMVLPQASPHHLKTPWKATENIAFN